MITSINHPWAISDKFVNRYGQIWASIDFVFESKISSKNFKTDPMNCTIGTLLVSGNTIKMQYKDLVAYAKSMTTYTNNMYTMRPKKDDVFSIEIKGQNLLLVKHEIAKLNDTINDALDAALRNYELGLYL